MKKEIREIIILHGRREIAADGHVAMDSLSNVVTKDILDYINRKKKK